MWETIIKYGIRLELGIFFVLFMVAMLFFYKFGMWVVQTTYEREKRYEQIIDKLSGQVIEKIMDNSEKIKKVEVELKEMRKDNDNRYGMIYNLLDRACRNGMNKN